MDQQPDLILCAAGLALCLFGWLLYWGGIHVVGGLAGAALATVVAWQAIGANPAAPHRTLVFCLSAGIGLVIGIFLLRRLHFGVVALMGAALGLGIGFHLSGLIPGAGSVVEATFMISGAVAGAFLFVLCHRYVIILATSALGALLLGLGLTPQNPLLALSIAFPTACVVQLGVARRFGLARRPDEDGLAPGTAEAS